MFEEKNKLSAFSTSIMELRYSWTKEDGTKETWDDIAKRVTDNVLSIIPISKSIKNAIYEIISRRKFIPGGRFLAQAGRPYHQTNNCFCLRAEDTREEWGELNKKATIMLMSGGGIGVDYSKLRCSGTSLIRSGGTSSGPIPLIYCINEIGRGVISGGKRRSAIWAGLLWNHPDIDSFIVSKNWIPEVKKIKEKNFDFPATLDMTNISIILDKEFFKAYENEGNLNHELAQGIYWKVIDNMCKTGEPGFSVNYKNSNESLRNACTEIVSEDDSDVCCLGSINLPNISSIEELEWIVDLAILFLLVGTEYADIPYPTVKEIREKNRRLGLGLMGFHEWLLLRGYNYSSNNELEEWLKVWKEQSEISSKKWAEKLSFNTPIKSRAIAPNGTISIAGGLTTSGIEPIFSVAYQRRYLLAGDGWKKQYVIDPVAEKLIEAGINIDQIEDAYTLSLDVERRINFQSFVQKYVDNSISSTINLPSFGSFGNEDTKKFGETLYKYLPSLRGITVYPNGARGGQPIIPVDYEFAKKYRGTIFEGHEECSDGLCGI